MSTRLAWQRWLAIALVLLGTVAGAAGAAQGIETRPLQFAKGATSVIVKGSIKGDRTIDYTLRARGGQTMSVTLETRHGANTFNVLPPGSNDVAIFVGSSGGNAWTGPLPADGEYRIRVYLMRSAARRNEVADYTLSVRISGDGAAGAAIGTAPAADARVKGTPYHATGQLPCAMGSAPTGSTQCAFGVIRGKPGNAELHLTPPGGFKRVLNFLGERVSADGGAKVEARRNGELWTVDVNDHEHYRIPQVVISGG